MCRPFRSLYCVQHMEKKQEKVCLCRLAASRESGRVRWCVGHEKSWQTKLKRLVFVPIVLLPLVIAVIVLTRFYPSSRTHQDQPQTSTAPGVIFDLNESKDDYERRDVLRDMKTNYAPNENLLQDSVESRNKREIPFNGSTQNRTFNDSPNAIHTDRKYQNEIEHLNNMEGNFFSRKQLDFHQIRTLQGETMLKYMNVNTDPCDDFYEYACGKWDKYHSIPADRSSYDTFEMLRVNLDVVLRNLLVEDEELLPVNNDSENEHLDAATKVKLYYKSCMNEERIEEREKAPLIDLLDDLGKWPIISQNWTESSFNLAKLLGQLKLFNNDILVTEWIGPDIINSKYHIVQIDQTTLGLPGRNYFLDQSYSKYVKAYKDFLISVATYLGGDYEQIIDDADALIDFEIKLAKITIPSENRRNVTDLYLRTNTHSLKKFFPELDWELYFNIVLGKSIALDEEIACYCMGYLYKLFELIKAEKPRTIANYLLWRFVRHRTNNLGQKFIFAKQKFYQVLFGREEMPPRWQFCVSQVNTNMGMALGSLFVRRFFDENSKNDTLEMTAQLQEAFISILKENKWLGDHTKTYAKMKINQMNLKIGYPDFLLDNDLLNDRYYDVTIHPGRFFENTISILRHLTRIEQKKMGQEVNKTVWGTAPAVVNAYYSRNKNQIIFPAGILQPPFYHKHFPKSLNFGGIGVVIGHEITHGFDDKGRLFDQHGNLQQWWKEDSIQNFRQRAKCMIDQYNSYVVPDADAYINGFITQGENIADNGGLKQAFKAYENWLKNNPDADETLPGLNLTGKQLFFLNFAQVWCGKQRLETLKNRLKVAVHSPGIFRVIGTLSNSEDFAKVYNCPKNSSMNPVQKCSLW